MATYFPLKGENHENSISLINYQPRVPAEHMLANEVHKIIARNHGFDYRNEDAFENLDTVEQAEMVGKIFDAMNMFLGTVGLVTLTLGAIGVINIMLVAVSRAHPGDRVAQSSGRHQPQHSAAVFPGRAFFLHFLAD